MTKLETVLSFRHVRRSIYSGYIVSVYGPGPIPSLSPLRYLLCTTSCISKGALNSLPSELPHVFKNQHSTPAFYTCRRTSEVGTWSTCEIHRTSRPQALWAALVVEAKASIFLARSMSCIARSIHERPYSLSIFSERGQRLASLP